MLFRPSCVQCMYHHKGPQIAKSTTSDSNALILMDFKISHSRNNTKGQICTGNLYVMISFQRKRYHLKKTFDTIQLLVKKFIVHDLNASHE